MTLTDLKTYQEIQFFAILQYFSFLCRLLPLAFCPRERGKDSQSWLGQ